MFKLVISCSQAKYPENEDPPLVMEQNGMLDSVVILKVSQVVGQNISKRVGDYVFDSRIWVNIMQYLRGRDIFSLVVAVCGWSDAPDLKDLKTRSSLSDGPCFSDDFIRLLGYPLSNDRFHERAVGSIEQSFSFPSSNGNGVILCESMILQNVYSMLFTSINEYDYQEVKAQFSNVGGCFWGGAHWLASLRELDITYSHLSTCTLIKIMDACPLLIGLKANFKYNWSNLLDKISKEESRIHTNLQSLDLSGSELCCKGLSLLLKKVPALRLLILVKLKMHHTSLASEDFYLESESLFHLKGLNLSGADFKGFHIRNFLLAAPHLERVNVLCEPRFSSRKLNNQRVQVKRLSHSFSTLPENSLSSLQVIHLLQDPYDPFSVSKQYDAIMAASHSDLKTYKPSWLEGRSWHEDLEDDFIFSLEDLRALLKAAPNLDGKVRDLIEKQIRLQEKVAFAASEQFGDKVQQLSIAVFLGLIFARAKGIL